MFLRALNRDEQRRKRKSWNTRGRATALHYSHLIICAIMTVLLGIDKRVHCEGRKSSKLLCLRNESRNLLGQDQECHWVTYCGFAYMMRWCPGTLSCSTWPKLICILTLNIALYLERNARPTRLRVRILLQEEPQKRVDKVSMNKRETCSENAWPSQVEAVLGRHGDHPDTAGSPEKKDAKAILGYDAKGDDGRVPQPEELLRDLHSHKL